MKPKILLTGKTGQVGSELASSLSELGKVFAPGRQQLDLSKPDAIRAAIRDIEPQMIVNAAAYTAVDKAETDQDVARAINADAPGIMAEEGKKIGAMLVHYSTDYVFDGTKNAPYSEDDNTNPLNVYGTTKLMGEEAIRATGISHLIFRTSWVYATEGRNFLLTVLRLATERDELRIIRDQFGAPTRNLDIAKATTNILQRLLEQSNNGLGVSDLAGTYHMTAAGMTTWFEFCKAILDDVSATRQHLPWLTRATGGRPLVTKRVIPITAEEYPTDARRPAYSLLSSSLLTRTFDITLLDWRTQLRALFS